MKKYLSKLSNRNIFRLVLVILFVGFGTQVSATHFRYGYITWSRDAVNPLKINFKITQAWRRGYPWNGYSPSNPVPPNVNDVIDFGGNFPFNFGDGNQVNVLLKVTSISVADDWILGEFLVSHTYTSTGFKLAFFEGAARLSGPPTTPLGPLQNNGDGNFRVETGVTVGNNNDAPVSTLPPIINMVVGNPAATYLIPATDPDGDAITFSFPSNTSYGGGTEPPGLLISPGGLITFNTTSPKAIGQFYNAIIRLTDSKGAYVHLDVLIKIVGSSNPPVYDYSPGNTPANNFTYTITPGQNLAFLVKATDPDVADYVTLFGNGIPIGAVLAPGLPTSGAVNGPVQTNFSWTPTIAQTGTYVMTFIAQDPQGVQTPTTVKVTVACNSSLTTSVAEPSCFNTTDGSITVTASGTAPFMFSKDGGVNYVAGANPFIFSGLGQGSYGIRVKGGNGCESAVAQTHVGLNLVDNGDFEAGNTGFTSSYNLNTIGIIDEGEYAVSIVPNHPCFSGPDHTPSGPGNAMYINGSGVANTVVWSQTINIQAGTVYYFSAWVKGQCSNVSPAILQFSINGSQVGANFSPPNATTWTQFFIPWNSGANTTATIKLVNQNTIAGGNDFSIDDILFTTIAPVELATVTKTDVTCLGSNDGSITITASGGIGAYQYSINGGTNYTGGSNPHTFSGLAPGSYIVKVKDACGVESNTQLVQVITIPDITPPSITCPSDIAVNNDPGLCSAKVTVPAVLVSDNCGVVCNTDDIDAYSPGPINGQSPQWAPWVSQPSGQVSSEQFFSAPYSMKIAGPAVYGSSSPDQLFLLGNQTGGKWTLSFKMFVGTGHTAQYNMQRHEIPGVQWAHQVEFLSNGTGFLYSNATTGFSYPQDQWFDVVQKIDQVTNQASLSINGVVIHAWPFATGPQINQIGALDFFAQTGIFTADPNPAATSLFYIDDITLCGDPARMGSYIARRYSKVYAVGSHTVPITISDLSGNTDQCSFNVTVTDNELPVISAPSVLSCFAANNFGCSINLGATATDNCGVLSLTSDAPACFPVGTTTVTWTAKDIHGNSSTATQLVTRNPEINIGICAGITRTIYTGTVNGAGPFGPQSINLTSTATGGTPGYTYKWTPSTGLDNSLIANPVASPTATTTYTLTVTDSKGCTRSLSITINVVPLSSAVCSGSGNNVKFSVCHIPPGNPSNPQNICISANALPAHLTSGSNGHNNCHLGPCGEQLCFNTVPGANNFVQVKEAIVETDATPVIVAALKDAFKVNAFPNPSASEFSLQVTGSSMEPITVRIMDMNGVVKSVSKVVSKTNMIKVGATLPAGTYMAEVTQGQNKQVIKLVKLH